MLQQSVPEPLLLDGAWKGITPLSVLGVVDRRDDFHRLAVADFRPQLAVLKHVDTLASEGVAPHRGL
eukprot:4027518-Amphidinium_carterae.1